MITIKYAILSLVLVLSVVSTYAFALEIVEGDPSEIVLPRNFDNAATSIVIYNSSDLFLQETFNFGEFGVDINGENKGENGLDDDGNGIVDDHSILYARTVSCDLVIYVNQSKDQWNYYMMKHEEGIDSSQCFQYFIDLWEIHSRRELSDQ